MPWVKTPHGNMHVKLAKTPRQRCKHPGCQAWATKLCDYPVPARRSMYGHRLKSGTCDTRFCEAHGVSVGPNKDHCWLHAAEPAPQEELEL